MDVVIDKSGRMDLPKETMERYGLDSNSRLIIRENIGSIILIPVKKHLNPVDSLFGCIRVDAPIDEPKTQARNHIKKRVEAET
jgi:bifunctional DNA-binding transcriptional regulator/antitoxin component of YhaV-PrlF toxin-antitoxin module